MSDIAHLYDPLRHRYRFVYPHGRRWRTVVVAVDGRRQLRGVHDLPEQAAMAAVAYYKGLLGADWLDMIRTRRRNAWRVRKVSRTQALAVWLAEVGRDRGVVRVGPEDVCDAAAGHWSAAGDGWLSQAAALVAVRTYRDLHRINSLTARAG